MILLGAFLYGLMAMESKVLALVLVELGLHDKLIFIIKTQTVLPV